MSVIRALRVISEQHTRLPAKAALELNPFRLTSSRVPSRLAASVGGNGIKPVLIFDLPVAGRRCACPPRIFDTLRFLPLKSRLASLFPLPSRPPFPPGEAVLRIYVSVAAS